MICQKCGNEKFKIITVLRNRKFEKGKFRFNKNFDSRIVMCKLCGTRYITETSNFSEIINKNFKLVAVNKKGECKIDDDL